jgi:hypothetical protein
MKLASISNISVQQLRTHVETIIENARTSAHISARLAERGWGAEKMDALDGYLDAFAGAAKRFDDLRRAKDSASADFDHDADAFRRSTFATHVGLAKAAFATNANAQREIGLDDGVGSLDVAHATWYPNASDFYARILEREDLQAPLADLNLTVEELQAAATEVNRLQDLYERRGRLEADRQQARSDRDAHRAVLETELRRFQQVARVVFADEPQHLEQLGFVVPSN